MFNTINMFNTIKRARMPLTLALARGRDHLPPFALSCTSVTPSSSLSSSSSSSPVSPPSSSSPISPSSISSSSSPSSLSHHHHHHHLLHHHRTFSTQPQRVRVLYDGLCPICVAEVRLLQFYQRNKPEKVTFVDISLPGYEGAEVAGVSYDAAMREMHVIDERDKVHRGVPAFSVLYRAVGLGCLGRLMMWGPVRPLMDRGYAVFARNRPRWTGRGGECRTDSCAKKTR